ncbi:polynucleotide kinase 3'-phosphatase, putative [Babesia bigemina]|uniref:Polynucleotide kinase 3'-phosphatase, putative n=1 Tax=Babesia bigemina TaxID=5866 RepID=A0A061DCK9_BABBI|nr:polynucleotide kinase 3'-phosphatase, putative [Babesia bigemina]CDR97842.1 polynucleotide kinase 3'-phosphatase, putative [Babesia bigemina]|eukprot:XP_012770028.1 polynucleotide kinase 3'-phosphatase, putative [Babesia bigemina]
MQLSKAIVICSNQSQLFEVPRVSKLIFARIQLLLNELDIPLYILLGFRRDLSRKPGPGMLTFYEQHLNEGIEVDRANSFYVGDAAGRVWTDELLDAHCERVMALLKAEDFSNRSYVRKDRYFNDEPVDANAIIAKLKPASLRNKFEADFSDCDLKYALNNNVGFYTPEEYFANHPSMPLTVDFDPKKVGTNPAPLDVTGGMVILVGPPSGGKTFLCKNKFASFTRINEDELRTRDAGVRAARECLQRGENVIIDGANAIPEKRRDYIAVSRAAGVSCTVVFLDVSVNFSLHFFRYRKVSCDVGTQFTPPQIVEPQEYAHLSQNVVRTYFKQMQPPDESEGFDRLLRITDETFPVQHTPVSQMHLP